MEKFLTRHIWTIAIIFWWIVFSTWLIQYINLPTWKIMYTCFWISELNKTIPTQYMFTTIWAICAFWYWYKRYERDKELEIIEKLWKEYDLIKKDKDWKKLVSLWFKEYYFFKNWYIKKEWWKYISDKIWRNIATDENKVSDWILNEMITLTGGKSKILKDFSDFIKQKISISLTESKELKDKISENKKICLRQKNEINKIIEVAKNEKNVEDIKILKKRVKGIDSFVKRWEDNKQIIDKINYDLEYLKKII